MAPRIEEVVQTAAPALRISFSEEPSSLDGATVKTAGTGSTLSFHDEVGPEPHVKLPSGGGGPLSDREETVHLKFFDVPVRLFARSKVETEGSTGPDGSAESSAKAAHLGDNSFIDEIESECRAQLGDVDGSTDIESSRLSADYFPEHPAAKITLGKDPEGTLRQLPALAILQAGTPHSPHRA